MLSGSTTKLRAIEREDLRQLRDWRNTESLRVFYREFRELSLDDQHAWLDAMRTSKNHIMLVIESAADSTMLGVCGLTNIDWRLGSAELSVYIGHQNIYVDETYAVDALWTLVRYAFTELNMHKVWADVYEFDVLKNQLFSVWCGFNEDGRIRDNAYQDGRHWDSVIYSLLRSEYDARIGRQHAAPSGPVNWQYYAGQFENPYRSTVHFHEWLAGLGAFRPNSLVVDMGAGSGSVLSHFAASEPETEFLGLDVIDEVMRYGNRKLSEAGLDNARLEYGDALGVRQDLAGAVDGVFSSHFLLLFDDFRTPLHHILRYEPRWVAANSLFFDGNVHSQVRRFDYNTPVDGRPCKKVHYNIFSLPQVKAYLGKRGYTRFVSMPFDIDVDLAKGDSDLGTYTVRTEDGQRLQISGPMLMNWRFIYAERP